MRASGVGVRFGGIVALTDVNLDIPAQSIIGLVGPNGAGKTTLFNVLSGLQEPNSGRVYLREEDVTHRTPQYRAHRGLARTFQQPELFTGLTVREHIVLGYRVRNQPRRVWRDLFTLGALVPPTKAETERVDTLLELLSLTSVAYQNTQALPLGTSRLVEVARALATDPAMLLLDEPMSGLNSNEAESLGELIRRTRKEEGVSILLVEHDVPMVLTLSDRITVLDFGVVIAEGTPAEIRSNPAVQAAYLGDEDTDSQAAPAENLV